MNRLLLGLRGARRSLCMVGGLAIGAVSFALNPAHRRDAASQARWLSATCRRLLWGLGVRVEMSGAPPQGALICSNHLGYLDILVLASRVPTVFVSKAEVRGWPVFGWFAEKAGTRFIDRKRRGDVVRIAEELTPLLDAGLNVVVFLEGTSSDGSTVLPFKSSLLEPAVRAGWPVMPAALSYQVPVGRSAEREVCWWGDMTLSPHLWRLMTLPWVHARVAWGRMMPSRDVDRKALAESLRQAVVALKGNPIEAERAALSA